MEPRQDELIFNGISLYSNSDRSLLSCSSEAESALSSLVHRSSEVVVELDRDALNPIRNGHIDAKNVLLPDLLA